MSLVSTQSLMSLVNSQYSVTNVTSKYSVTDVTSQYSVVWITSSCSIFTDIVSKTYKSIKILERYKTYVNLHKVYVYDYFAGSKSHNQCYFNNFIHVYKIFSVSC